MAKLRLVSKIDDGGWARVELSRAEPDWLSAVDEQLAA